MSSLPFAGLHKQSKSAKAVAIALRKTSQTQTIYLSPGKLGFPLVIYACAFVNIVFWGNLAQWVYSDYTIKNEESDKFEKASKQRRVVYSGVLASIGLGISTAFALVSTRVVKRIDMSPGGQSITMYTGFFARQSTKHGVEIPLRDLSLRRSIYTGHGANEALSTTGTFTQLLRRKQLIGYLIDRRGHFLVSPRVMDELIQRETVP